MEHTVIVFGAGATKGCGGPLTNEILPLALNASEGRPQYRPHYLSIVREFLNATFYLTDHAQQQDYPPLPLLLSLLDVAIDRRESFGCKWPTPRLEKLRTAVEYIIFAVVTNELRMIDYSGFHENHYRLFFKQFDPRTLSVISFNYDIIADNALFELDHTLPDYKCDITVNRERSQPDIIQYHIPLYKLHGSLNWLYCPACQRLELAVSKTGMTKKVLDKLYEPPESETLEHQYKIEANLCTDKMCRTPVQAVMITPTHLKDYRNPHIARIWYEAAQALRQAQRVYFIGYSLPPEDVDIMYLLKRNLQHLEPGQIWVVEKDAQNRPLEYNEVGKRYRSLFGDGIRWCTCGFEKYIAAHGAGIENHRCENYLSSVNWFPGLVHPHS